MARLLVVALLAAALTGAVTVAASQPVEFNVQIEAKLLRPDGGCPDGAFRCGTAEIDGFGQAEWRFYLVSFVRTPECVSYDVVSTFTLADDSVLELDETGTVCGPGNSFFATRPSSWGNPEAANGTWEFVSGTGQFSGLTGGTGFNHLRSHGADVRGVYAGSLEE